MGGLIALTTIVHAVGIGKIVAQRDSAAIACALLGNLCYGASIVLIAQAYHLGEHMPDGVLWWALGTLPVALVLRESWTTLMTGALAITWWAVQARTGFLDPWTICALMPAFIAVQLYTLAGSRGQSKTVLATCLITTTAWFETLLATLWRKYNGELALSEEHLFASAALMITLASTGALLATSENATRAELGATTQRWMAGAGIAMLFILGFSDPWQWLMDADWDHARKMQAIVTALLMRIGGTTHRSALPEEYRYGNKLVRDWAEGRHFAVIEMQFGACKGGTSARTMARKV